MERATVSPETVALRPRVSPCPAVPFWFLCPIDSLFFSYEPAIRRSFFCFPFWFLEREKELILRPQKNESFMLNYFNVWFSTTVWDWLSSHQTGKLLVGFGLQRLKLKLRKLENTFLKLNAHTKFQPITRNSDHVSLKLRRLKSLPNRLFSVHYNNSTLVRLILGASIRPKLPEIPGGEVNEIGMSKDFIPKFWEYLVRLA